MSTVIIALISICYTMLAAYAFYRAVVVLGNISPKTLFLTIYAFCITIIIVITLFAFSIKNYYIDNFGYPLTRFGEYLSKSIIFETNIVDEFYYTIALLAAAIVPQVVADVITGLAGVAPGRVRFGWFIGGVIKLFAKSLIAFSAVEFGLLILKDCYRIGSFTMEMNFTTILVCFGVLAAGLLLLAVSINNHTYRGIVRHRRLLRLRRRWIRFSMRKRNFEGHRRTLIDKRKQSVRKRRVELLITINRRPRNEN